VKYFLPEEESTACFKMLCSFQNKTKDNLKNYTSGEFILVPVSPLTLQDAKIELGQSPSIYFICSLFYDCFPVTKTT
jgi:hypothetical protein